MEQKLFIFRDGCQVSNTYRIEPLAGDNKKAVTMVPVIDNVLKQSIKVTSGDGTPIHFIYQSGLFSDNKTPSVVTKGNKEYKGKIISNKGKNISIYDETNNTTTTINDYDSVEVQNNNTYTGNESLIIDAKYEGSITVTYVSRSVKWDPIINIIDDKILQLNAIITTKSVVVAQEIILVDKCLNEYISEEFVYQKRINEVIRIEDNYFHKLDTENIDVKTSYMYHGKGDVLLRRSFLTLIDLPKSDVNVYNNGMIVYTTVIKRSTKSSNIVDLDTYKTDLVHCMIKLNKVVGGDYHISMVIRNHTKSLITFVYVLELEENMNPINYINDIGDNVNNRYSLRYDKDTIFIELHDVPQTLVVQHQLSFEYYL